MSTLKLLEPSIREGKHVIGYSKSMSNRLCLLDDHVVTDCEHIFMSQEPFQQLLLHVWKLDMSVALLVEILSWNGLPLQQFRNRRPINCDIEFGLNPLGQL